MKAALKLNEKIYFCRKQKGLSQEELAERLAVSRQAVSKWETGESAPEISKLMPMAAIFQVSVDWLLSEEEPQGKETTASSEPKESPQCTNTGNQAQEEAQPQKDDAPHAEKPAPNWVESIPGVVGRLLRQYGWLFGVYTVIVGLVFLMLGFAGESAVRAMIEPSSMGGFPFGSGGPALENASPILDEIPGLEGAEIFIEDESGQMISYHPTRGDGFVGPFLAIIHLIKGFGVILMIGGTILAVALKCRQKKHDGDGRSK